ncbi:MAG: hypothetical protein V4487_05840 [Chlamydiota bacterium]
MRDCFIIISWMLLAAGSICADAPPQDGVLKTDVEGAQAFNEVLSQIREELRLKFEAASILAEKGAREIEYQDLLVSVRSLKEKIRKLEENWRKGTVDEASRSDEAYALWDVGETTLAQLIMEFGASDYLYIIPQELSGMKISLFSSIPLPHESWNEMIEMILSQNGVGVKKLNPFVKQLYILKLDPSAIEGIVDHEGDLELFSNHCRLFYVFSPPPEQLKSVQAFFERFSDPKQTTIQSIGSKVAIVSTKESIDKLLGLYHAVWEQGRGKVARMINLTKINSQEAEKVLKAVFADPINKNRPNFYPSNADELATLVLPQGLVLVGENETVERGQKILTDLETQLEDPGEKLIYWYTCKHSNPEDIAEVLEKVYDSLVGSSFDKKADGSSVSAPPPVPSQDHPVAGQVFPIPDRSTAFNPVLPAGAPFVQPGTIDKKVIKSSFGNFIVDTKTTSILMVVRRDELSKIKTLLKKLDVPKKMVQLDVLLVEKKLQDRKQIGFNLLQFGTNSSGKKETAITFDTKERAFNKGVLSFIFSRPSNGWPAMDLTYSFLLAQEDIRINANPSVLAINQTPATVSIVEEISINNGAIQLDTTNGITVEKSFTRAQYGITIVLTPTIHLPDDEQEGPGFVSLQTNLEFDTTKASLDDRPPVTRRHIENEVRVADGETIILGGLRRKIEEDSREKIPFLGELPGFGKLFGAAKQTETNTEMFIFITPRIIKDPVDDLRQIRQCEYRMRAGDVPEFLARIDEAKERERKCLFEDSLKTLFDLF